MSTSGNLVDTNSLATPAYTPSVSCAIKYVTAEPYKFFVVLVPKGTCGGCHGESHAGLLLRHVSIPTRSRPSVISDSDP